MQQHAPDEGLLAQHLVDHGIHIANIDDAVTIHVANRNHVILTQHLIDHRVNIRDVNQAVAIGVARNTRSANLVNLELEVSHVEGEGVLTSLGSQLVSSLVVGRKLSSSLLHQSGRASARARAIQ